MNPKRLTVAVGLLCLLLGSVPVSAASQRLHSVSLTLDGAIISSGTESYSHSGGRLASALIFGQPIDPSAALIHYSLRATISGMAVSGVANVSLTIKGSHDSRTEINVLANLDGMVPAEAFPLGCSLEVGNCTSAIPGLLTGLATVTVSNDEDGEDGEDSVAGADVLQLILPMAFESAFLNPFGGPIFMASEGGELFIVATYSQAKVQWSGIQLGGMVTGSLDGNPVSGYFAMNVVATEDLKAGYELDRGSITFFGMSHNSLNAVGKFLGTSKIPAGDPCPSLPPPLPEFPPGTCQLTGFSSKGIFSMANSQSGQILGKYSTAWTVPAVAFTSTVSAILK